MTPLSSLQATLTKLAQRLPMGSELVFRVDPEQLWIERICLPKTSRRQGRGSATLAQVLAAADRAGVCTALLADPTDQPDDPDSFALVRWYSRFGFQALAVLENGVAMERLADRRGLKAEALLAEARRAVPLTPESFARMQGCGRPRLPRLG